MQRFKFPSNIIQRETYLSRIEPFINKPIAKVFTGQRRVGKSFMLFQIMKIILKKDTNANIVYINKEDIAFEDIKIASDLNKYIMSHSSAEKVNYIFIDEIQNISDFEKAIRSLLLNENNDIYITGSNANLLSGELSTLLAGRTIEFNIHSLSYIEFLTFHKLTDSDENLLKYFKYGGLPYLINLDLTDDIVFEYLKNIYTTIVYRDVVSRYNIRSTNFLERLIRFLADNIGSLFSAKRISDFLKSQHVNIAHNQVQAFNDYLTNAFLIDKVQRYDVVGKRIFEVGEKYYFENCGIRNAVVGYKPGDNAKLLENIVYNQLLYKGYEVKIGWLQTQEIDFVATKNNETVYLQVALRIDNDKTIEREFGNLLKIKDNYPKIVIAMDEQFKNTYKGITYLSIRKFLMS
ncbi:MAG: ATP-binding protein [Bacteroidetes bacterium]|nr:ATP-binding protein [Bacteroidota bacterium]